MNVPALEIIRAGTRLSPVPLAPEIRLHLAAEPIELWEHTERVLGQTGQPPPFWAFAWAGGQALARYLLDHPAAVRGRRVLDIASGSGLVAIAAAMAGAASVIACDVDPLAVASIELNASANDVTVMAIGDDLLRDGQPDGGGPRLLGAEVVLVADAFYEKDLAARVTRFAGRARAHGAAVLLADPGRTYLPRAHLRPLASYDVLGVAALEDADHKHTTVWTPHP
jgi:predicted nicotinamide N-methyase